MWHEARRQEKLVRAKMVDNVRRNERRKQFYETVRKEPEGFMQLHGQRMPVHVDPSIAEAAEMPNAMRKWQGDPKVLIDRFDVRVYLDNIPETMSRSAKKNILRDDVVEIQCDYERYRILAFNEFRRVNEKQFLNEIASKEFWPFQQSSNHSSNAFYKKEKRKKLADKRTAIAFNYTDSATVQGTTPSNHQSDPEPDSSEEDEFDGPEEIDAIIDPNTIVAEQAAALNKIGAHYGVTSGAFLQLMTLDHNEQTSSAQIKEIDKAKLALSGRNAKADRAALKNRRALIVGNLGLVGQSNEEATTTLLSFLAKANKSDLKEDSTSSESGEELVKTEFITSFGEEAKSKRMAKEEGIEEDEFAGKETAIIQGPILPNKEYRRLLELSRRRSVSPKNEWEQRPTRRERNERHSRSPRRKSRSRSRERRRRTRSRTRSARRQHSKRTRSSSSSPSAKRIAISSSSISSSRRDQDQRRRSLQRRRNTNKNGRGSSSSSSFSSKDRNSRNGGRALLPQHSFAEWKSLQANRRSTSSSSSESDDSLLSVHSSMSESEKERIERENRKRRIRRTKQAVKKAQQSEKASTTQQGQQHDESESRSERAAKKLRQQMQKTLVKTAAQLKEEEEQRQREMQKEKKKRDDQLEEESRLLRKREREKRKVEEEQNRHRRRERPSRDGVGTEHRRPYVRRRSTSVGS